MIDSTPMISDVNMTKFLRPRPK